MKAFVISLSILILMVALTVLNSVCIVNITNSLIKEAEMLEVDAHSVSSFAKKWERSQLLIKLSSSHKETHRIDEVLEVLTEKARNKTENGFWEERALLIEYIIQIREDETVSLDSII